MTNLSLEFAKNADGKTFLENQYASYPFHICRTQYFENDPPGMANIYIQSASGGIYENESLTTNVIANADSFSHVTTQASTIVHGMTDGDAHQTVNINATDNSYTEYISDPLILFPQSNLSSTINVFADLTSTAIIADAFLLHFLNGKDKLFEQLKSYLQIHDENNQMLAKDVYIINPSNFLSAEREYIGMGTISIINRLINTEYLLEQLQETIKSNENIYGGATLLPNQCGIIIKFLAPDGDFLKKTITQLWMNIRESLIGTKPNIRKK